LRRTTLPSRTLVLQPAILSQSHQLKPSHVCQSAPVVSLGWTRSMWRAGGSCEEQSALFIVNKALLDAQGGLLQQMVGPRFPLLAL